MAINPKSGGLSALDPQDDTVDPQDKEFDYGSDTSDLRSYLASKVKARQQALAELPSYDEYAKNLTEARQPRSNLSQISEALLAYGRPLERGQSQWQALGNAATTLTKGIEAEDTAKRAEQIKRAQLKMQYLKAKSDVTGPYDEAIDALAIKAYEPVKAPTLASPVYDPFHRRIDQAGNLVQPGYALDNKGNLVKLDRTPTEAKDVLAQKYPQNQSQPIPQNSNAPKIPNGSKVENYTSMPDLINAPVGSFGMLNGTSYRIDEGGPVKLDIAPTVAMPMQIQEAIDKGLTGEEFLDVVKSVDGPMANQARAVLEGRSPLPTGARSNQRSQMIAQIAAQADPRLDATDYNVRFKTRQSFAAGPDAANITSINTVIKHFGALDSQIDKLQNTSFPWLNKPLQETRKNLGDKGQQEAISAFQTTKKLAAGELAKAIQGGPAHVQELKEINDLLDSSKTPTELRAAVKSSINLLSSRLEEIGNKYNNAMGLNSHPTSFLSKSNLKVYNRLMGLPEDTPQEIEGTTPSDKQPVSGGGAKPVSAQVTKVLRGKTYIQKPDGSWYAQ
jgi:hypothetical protein